MQAGQVFKRLPSLCCCPQAYSGAAHMSHNLRPPMNAITGFTALLWMIRRR